MSDEWRDRQAEIGDEMVQRELEARHIAGQARRLAPLWDVNPDGDAIELAFTGLGEIRLSVDDAERIARALLSEAEIIRRTRTGDF